MPSILNNREWATLIWLVLGLGFLCAKDRNTRGALWTLVRAFSTPVLLRSLLLMAGYIAAVVLGASYLGLWELDLTGGTAVWFLTVAMGLWYTVTRIGDDAHYLRSAAKQAVGITILFEAVANLYVLPIWAELILVPILTLLVAMTAVAEAKSEPEFRTARGPLRKLSIMFGWAILGFVAVHLVTDLLNGHFGHFLKGLALPVWLGLALIPFIYAFGLYLSYTTAFGRLRMAFNATPGALRRAKVALLLGVRANAYFLGGFAEPWPKRLNAAGSLTDARRVVTQLCAERGWRRLGSTPIGQ